MNQELTGIIFNTVGVTGVAIILLAYYLLTRGKLSSTAPRYHLMNLVGATMHLISLYYAWNLASFIIEVCWIGISLYGLRKALLSRQPDKP
jgi:hypothetical protein